MARHALRAFVLVSSLAFLAVFVLAAIDTVRGGAPADPVEAALVDQAQRFAERRLAYLEPAGEHPAAILPGVPALLALLVGADTPGRAQMRALTLLATLFTAFLLCFLVQMETRSWTLALAAAGLALAGQGLFTTAPGVARPEAFLMLLVLLAFAALRFLSGVSGALLAAVLLAAACFVEQQAILFLVAAACSQVVEGRRRFVTFVISAGLLVAVGTWVLSRVLGPWYNAAAWNAPFDALRFSPLAALRFSTTHLLGRLGVFTIVCVLSFALSTRPWMGPRGIWTWLAMAGVLTAVATTQNSAADPSALVPSVFAIALLGTLALQRVVHHLSDRYDSIAPGGEGIILTGLGIQIVVFLVFAADAGWIRAMASLG